MEDKSYEIKAKEISNINLNLTPDIFNGLINFGAILSGTFSEIEDPYHWLLKNKEKVKIWSKNRS